MSGKNRRTTPAKRTNNPAPRQQNKNSPDRAEAASVSFTSSHKYSGPIPPPSFLREYAEIYPDAPQIIFNMAQSQSEHRQGLERFSLRHTTIRAYAGLGVGMIVALAGLAAAVIIAVYASPAAGAIVGSVDLVGLVGVFVYGTRQVQESRDKKLRGSTEDAQNQLPLWDEGKP